MALPLVASRRGRCCARGRATRVGCNDVAHRDWLRLTNQAAGHAVHRPVTE